MSKIVQFNGYKTTDGELHAFYQDALTHQINVDLRDVLTKIIDDIYFHNIQPREIVEGLMEHRDELRRVLDGEGVS